MAVDRMRLLLSAAAALLLSVVLVLLLPATPPGADARGTTALNTTGGSEQPRYDTVYACEGTPLAIQCPAGKVIHLIRANYGRFSITICNEHGNTEWSVNCMSPKSLRVLHNRCSQQQNCSILAATSMFGDPCPGTLKYLEAHYQCMTESSTTERPSPPWFPTSRATLPWSTLPPPPPPPPPRRPPLLPYLPPAPTPPPPATEAPAATQPPYPLQPWVPPQTPATPVQTPEPPTVVTLTSTTGRSQLAATAAADAAAADALALAPLFAPEELARLCPPDSARAVFWNWTRAGEEAVQACPGGSSGRARRRCVAGGEGEPASWLPEAPDLSDCHTLWFSTLEARIRHGDSIASIGNELAQVTESVPLYGGDMLAAAAITRKLARKMAADVSTFPDPRQREAIVTELLFSVIRTGSNLLECSNHQSWKDLTHRQQLQVATELLLGLEENAFLLADAMHREKTVVQTAKNILLSVRVMPLPIVNDFEEFPLPTTHVPWPVSENWIIVPREALLDSTDGGYVRMVFSTFDRLDEVLQPKNDSQKINSKVIAVSLGIGKHIQVSKPVKITLQHIDTSGNYTNPSCVFWDYLNGVWSDEGCQVEKTNDTHTLCSCNHVTNFAILMDICSVEIDEVHEFALSFITYIGCIISIVCLALAFLTFQIFQGLKSDRTTIHKNLCMCLLIAELLFLFGIGQTDNQAVCGTVAGLLHFFFLCAFAWMFLEGFQLYVMLIEVFEAEKSRIRWYYIFAYGVPLIIVLVSCCIDYKSYGTNKYCWLRADNYFIFSFVGPVIAVILANLVFLSMAIYMMCRHARASASMKSKEHSRLASANGKEENALQNKLQSHLSWLRGAIVLVFLLGLTWTFGLLYLNQESIVMAYIFTILNSFQGLFIFVFHCVQNDKVRKEYRKLVRRYPWLQCRRKSSRGGTAKEHGGRSAASGSGSGSGSGYAANNPNSHSTDSSALSPHGTSNISFKSYSRDSGHGGSEQEDSGTSANPSTLRLQPVMRERESHIAGSFGGAPRSPSPWNHTYTEICDGDPVYEEVGRRAAAIVHVDSDGTSRRRVAGLSVGAGTLRADHRPLMAGLDRDTITPRARNARTVAVLDGETVVCHLEPERYETGEYDPREYEAGSYDYGTGSYDIRQYGMRGYDTREFEVQHLSQAQPQQLLHHHHHHRRRHHREQRENRDRELHAHDRCDNDYQERECERDYRFHDHQDRSPRDPDQQDYDLRDHDRENQAREHQVREYLGHQSRDHAIRGRDHTSRDRDDASHDCDDPSCDHDHTSHGHDHTSRDHENASRDREHTSRDRDHTSRDRALSSLDRDHTSRDRDHTRRDRDHTSRDRDHTSRDRTHISRSRDHVSRDRDHVSRGRGHASRNRGHPSRGRDHTIRGRDQTTRDRDNASRGREHASCEREQTSCDREHTIRDHDHMSHDHPDRDVHDHDRDLHDREYRDNQEHRYPFMSQSGMGHTEC